MLFVYSDYSGIRCMFLSLLLKISCANNELLYRPIHYKHADVTTHFPIKHFVHSLAFHPKESSVDVRLDVRFIDVGQHMTYKDETVDNNNNNNNIIGICKAPFTRNLF